MDQGSVVRRVWSTRNGPRRALYNWSLISIITGLRHMQPGREEYWSGIRNF